MGTCWGLGTRSIAVDAETGFGLVTDVCLKRKVRNFVGLVKEEQPPFEIYVKEKAILNNQHKRAYVAIGAGDLVGESAETAEAAPEAKEEKAKKGKTKDKAEPASKANPLKTLSESSRYACEVCGNHFCIDCDLFAHEVLHNCPGCVSNIRCSSLPLSA